MRLVVGAIMRVGEDLPILLRREDAVQVELRKRVLRRLRRRVDGARIDIDQIVGGRGRDAEFVVSDVRRRMDFGAVAAPAEIAVESVDLGAREFAIAVVAGGLDREIGGDAVLLDAELHGALTTAEAAAAAVEL